MSLSNLIRKREPGNSAIPATQPKEKMATVARIATVAAENPKQGQTAPPAVALVMDAETLAAALALAGPAGLWWREGTPADWSDARLLAAGEVLYADGWMVNRNDRRYLKEHAPPIPDISADIGQTKDSAESIRGERRCS